MTRPNATLNAEHAHMLALLTLLQQEQELLVTADADQLAELTPRKLALTQQLAQLARERHSALGAAGYAASEAGMAPWLAAQADHATREEWEQLLARTAEAKELNRVNGMLVNRQLAHTQSALNALRGPAQGSHANLYGAKGVTVGSAPSRGYVIG